MKLKVLDTLPANSRGLLFRDNLVERDKMQMVKEKEKKKKSLQLV